MVMWKPLFSARVNSFRCRPDLFFDKNVEEISTLDLLRRAAEVEELDAVDLNYPDHLANGDKTVIQDIKKFFQSSHLGLNSLAPRYYSDDQFKTGALSHKNANIRQAAIDLTKKTAEAALDLDCNLVTIWLSQEGNEYPFQSDYAQEYDLLVESLREVVQAYPQIRFSIEYKHGEPRGFSLVSNIMGTLLLIRDIDQPNVGVTIDFCHALFGREQPAASAALAMHKSTLLGLHMNDGYGYRDDGLIVGSIHPWQTLELFYVLAKAKNTGALYFDTFPTYQDPIEECKRNIRASRFLIEKASDLVEKNISFSQSDFVDWVSLVK
jgi:xylose isomerase